jgi:hypothetical protein
MEAEQRHRPDAPGGVRREDIVAVGKSRGELRVAVGKSRTKSGEWA